MQKDFTPTPESYTFDHPENRFKQLGGLFIAGLVFMIIVPFYVIFYSLEWVWEKIVEFFCVIIFIIIDKFRKDDID